MLWIIIISLLCVWGKKNVKLTTKVSISAYPENPEKSAGKSVLPMWIDMFKKISAEPRLKAYEQIINISFIWISPKE